jgi:predicted ester cyclase
LNGHSRNQVQGVFTMSDNQSGNDVLDSTVSRCMDNLRRWFGDGWGQRDFDLIDELFAPEFQAEGGGAARLDRLGYKAYCESIIKMTPDLSTHVVELIPAGDIVVSRVRTSGTHSGEVQGHQPTGRAFDTIVTDVWKFDDDGRIINRVNAEMDAEYLTKIFGKTPQFKP